MHQDTTKIDDFMEDYLPNRGFIEWGSAMMMTANYVGMYQKQWSTFVLTVLSQKDLAEEE